MLFTVWSFRHALIPYWKSLTVGTLLIMFGAVLSVAAPWPLKVIVDDVIKHQGRSHYGLQGTDLLTAALILFVALTLIGAISAYLSDRLLDSVGEKVTAALRAEVFGHLQKMSLAFHDRQRLGDLVTRTTSDVNYVESLLLAMLSVLIPNVIILVFIGAVCFVVDARFALIALAVAPLLFVTVVYFRRKIKAASKVSRSRDGDIATVVTETFSSVRVMQAYTSESRHEGIFRNKNEARLAAGLRVVRLQAALTPLVDTIIGLGTVLVLWVGAQRVLDNTMSLGLLLVFLAYLKSLYDPMRALAKLTTVVTRGQVSAERLTELLDTPAAIVDSPGAVTAPRFSGAVELRDVTFGYDAEQPVLHNISLLVRPGEMVAITGPTGAGKSSLVGLIPRLYDVDGGQLLLDGHDVRSLRLASVREQISLVLQEPVLFHGTIYDNIAYGTDNVTRQQVIDAAHAAFVDEFVQDLPLGYSTPVSERGASLSGGQRQRVAIARALVRNSPIVILDEPTSGLDAISERYVMRSLERLMEGRTVIVIAHRLATLRRADRIVVIDDGRIVEMGTHQELLSSGGLYSHLDGVHSADTSALLGVVG